MNEDLIYLDNAATTFPKPRQVFDRMLDAYARIGVSPGRGSYDLALQAEQFVNEARQKVARFFGAPDPDRVIFAANATDALNNAISGIIEPGDHVVSTRLEHNSVLRPLYHLKKSDAIALDLVPFDAEGFVDPEDIDKSIRSNTRLVIVNHASNVLGSVQPVREIARRCAAKGVPLLIDASQSAGTIPIDMAAWNLSAIAFTGHKALYGPTGTGGLILHPDLDVKATRFGGTGIDSRNLRHTPTYPHRLEAGTINLLGIAGLSAGIDFIEQQGQTDIHHRETALLQRLIDGLTELNHVKLYCARNFKNRVAVVSANVIGKDPSDVGAILDADFNIAVRVGLHCAPLVHEAIGTLKSGAVRFSIGVFNTSEDIDKAVAAMASLR